MLVIIAPYLSPALLQRSLNVLSSTAYLIILLVTVFYIIHLARNSILHHAQHGFVKQRSVLHRVREKRGHSILGITLTNLDTASYFLAQIILILQPTKTLEKLAQHCNIVTWR